MNYRYDQLHRIAAAHASKWEGIWTTTEGSYNTSYAYDGNGNIQNLYRNNLEATTIDELHYHYDPVKKNRLDVVKDGGTAEGLNNQQPYEYKYDKIGNLTKNLEDGIEDIKWNIYGKVEKVSKTNGTLISYRYDGTGNRILKEVRTTTTVHTNFYLRDASGNVMAIYEDTKPINSPTTNIALKEIPIYGSSRLGQYRPKTDAKKTALGQRIYEFSNHLGNVLVTLTDNKVPQTDGTYESVVVSASDYYPFGLAMTERTYSNSEYRYGFNGKENDTDFGSHIQDLGARFYSGALGRMFSTDPFIDELPFYSPYCFAGNSPILLLDLDGMAPTVYWAKFNVYGQGGVLMKTSEGFIYTRYEGEGVYSHLIYKGGKWQPYNWTYECLSCELQKAAGWVVREGLRLGTPAEEVKILLDGKDFDGKEVSTTMKTVAGIFLIIDFVPGSKLLKTATKSVKMAAGGKTALKWIRIGSKIDFGDRAQLAKVIGTLAGEEAHHIIPWALRNDDFIQSAAEVGFHLNDKVNGKSLKKYVKALQEGDHGNHPAYNKLVRDKIDDYINKGGDNTAEGAKKFLENDLIPFLNNILKKAENFKGSLNDYTKTLSN